MPAWRNRLSFISHAVCAVRARWRVGWCWVRAKGHISTGKAAAFSGVQVEAGKQLFIVNLFGRGNDAYLLLPVLDIL